MGQDIMSEAGATVEEVAEKHAPALDALEVIAEEAFEKTVKECEASRINAALDGHAVGSSRELKFDYKGAYDAYKIAAEIDPSNPEYQISAGTMAIAIEIPEAAVEHFSKAIELSENKEEILAGSVGEFIHNHLSERITEVDESVLKAVKTGVENRFAPVPEPLHIPSSQPSIAPTN